MIDKRGRKFLAGRLGQVTVLVYESAERAGGGDPKWHMWIRQRRESNPPDLAID
jgi:hypothetical protein